MKKILLPEKNYSQWDLISNLSVQHSTTQPLRKVVVISLWQQVSYCSNWFFGLESVVHHYISNLKAVPEWLSTRVLDSQCRRGRWYPCFWTSGDFSSGFQSQSEQPYLHLAEVYMLYIPWDSPLVQHLSTSCQSWWPACENALVVLKTGTYHATDKCSTNWSMPTKLQYC